MATTISSFDPQHRPEDRGDRPDGPWRRGRFADEVRGRVASTVNTQKDRAAAGLGGVAGAIRRAGDELRTQDESLAVVIEMMSDQLRRFAERVREQGVEEMAAEVAEFGRRRPVAFIGGAFLIGLALARFLKSTASPDVRYGSRRSVARAGTWSPAADVEPATTLEEELARTGGGF